VRLEEGRGRRWESVGRVCLTEPRIKVAKTIVDRCRQEARQRECDLPHRHEINSEYAKAYGLLRWTSKKRAVKFDKSQEIAMIGARLQIGIDGRIASEFALAHAANAKRHRRPLSGSLSYVALEHGGPAARTRVPPGPG
jgi:hypothetical protein